MPSLDMSPSPAGMSQQETLFGPTLDWGWEGAEGRDFGHSQLCGDTAHCVHPCRFAHVGV